MGRTTLKPMEELWSRRLLRQSTMKINKNLGKRITQLDTTGRNNLSTRTSIINDGVIKTRDATSNPSLHWITKPFAWSIESRKSQSTVSKAFSKSSFKTTTALLEKDQSSISSLAIKVASKICLLATKASWLATIVRGIVR